MQIVVRIRKRRPGLTLLLAAACLLPAGRGLTQGAPAAIPEVPLETESAPPPAFNPATNQSSPGTAAQTPVVATTTQPREPFMPLEEARKQMRRAFVEQDYDRVIELGEKIEDYYHVNKGNDYYVRAAQRRIDQKSRLQQDPRPYRRLSDIPTSLDLLPEDQEPATITVAAKTPSEETTAPADPAAAEEQPVPATGEADPASAEATPADRVVALATPAAEQTPGLPLQAMPPGAESSLVLTPVTKQTQPPLGMIIVGVVGLLLVVGGIAFLLARRRGGEAEVATSGRVTEDSPGVNDSLSPAPAGGPMIFEEEDSEASGAALDAPLRREQAKDDFESMFTIEPAPQSGASHDFTFETAPPAPAAPPDDSQADLDRMFGTAGQDPFSRGAAPAPPATPERYAAGQMESFIEENAPPIDESSIAFDGDTMSQRDDDTPDPGHPRLPNFEDSGIIQLDDLMLRDEDFASDMPPLSEFGSSLELDLPAASDLPMAPYDGPSVEGMNTAFSSQTVAPLKQQPSAPPQVGQGFEALPDAELTVDPNAGGGETTMASLSLPAIEDTADSTSTGNLPAYQEPDLKSFRPDETVEIALSQVGSLAQDETLGIEPETLPSVPLEMLNAQTQVSEITGFDNADPSAQTAASAAPPAPPTFVMPAAQKSPAPTAPAHSDDLFDREARMGEFDFANGNWAGAVHHFSIAAALRPEEHSVKERLREARRMRKEAQGN